MNKNKKLCGARMLTDCVFILKVKISEENYLNIKCYWITSHRAFIELDNCRKGAMVMRLWSWVVAEVDLRVYIDTR